MSGRRRSHRPSSPGYASQPVASSSRSQPMFSSQAVSRPSNASERSFVGQFDLDESVNGAVSTALSLFTSGKPFKKADLLQGSRVKNRSAVEAIIKETQQQLFAIYGLKLVEIPPGKFILIQPKDEAFRSYFVAKCDAVSPAFSSMLGVILTLILIQKGRLAEEYLKNVMLPKLFPDIGISPHPFFGNVDKLFQEFENLAYITKEIEARGGENKAFYRWGIRAHQEVDQKSLIVPVIQTMFGGNVPSSLLAELDKEN